MEQQIQHNDKSGIANDNIPYQINCMHKTWCLAFGKTISTHFQLYDYGAYFCLPNYECENYTYHLSSNGICYKANQKTT